MKKYIYNIIRYFRIKLGFWSFGRQLKINGIVECLCGGQIISNSGKVIFNQDMRLKCWRCGKTYVPNYVYYERKENEIVVYRGK